ncbi:MAG: hypothetical protein HPY83_06035 [Anaerolineae bacterium]|nr:hypothetical protein [Anaerolineae bacterium]
MSRRLFSVLAVAYLAAGLAAGLLLGWAWQIGPGGCDLGEMSPPYLWEYLGCVALARPTTREEARCAFPELDDLAIATMAEEAAAQAMAAGDRTTGRALVSLASVFGRQRPDLLVYAATLEALSQVQAEDTAVPSVSEATPRSGAGQPFYVVTRLQSACDRSAREDAVQVRVFGPQGEGVAGQRIRLEWQRGSQVAVTGLKEPGQPGYADFRLSPGAVYRLYAVGAGGEAVSRAVELSVAAAGCGGDEWAVWLIDLTRLSGEATPPTT